MELSQKVKYFAFGIVATAIIVPLTINAVETIPITFSEGDVISAGVINSLLKRVNDTSRGFSSSSEIVGTWVCTTYSVSTSCGAGFNPTGGGIQVARTQNITFACSSGSCTATASSFFPGSCNGGGSLSQGYELSGNVMASGWGVHAIQRINPTRFVWQINSSTPQQHYVICNNSATPPPPADALQVTVTESESVAVLTWIDQSTDETGFKVQRKPSATGTWVDLTTTAANALTYADSTVANRIAGSGTYWYRVLATNGNGDSMSSSEVQIVLSAITTTAATTTTTSTTTTTTSVRTSGASG